LSQTGDPAGVILLIGFLGITDTNDGRLLAFIVLTAAAARVTL
jgi:hypothetical protein